MPIVKYTHINTRIHLNIYINMFKYLSPGPKYAPSGRGRQTPGRNSQAGIMMMMFI
jgi:hypothetical protein